MSRPALTLYQKIPPHRALEDKAIEHARRSLAQIIVLGLLHSDDPIVSRRVARWEEIARLRLRQLRGLPISRQAHLACAYADKQKWSWMAARPNLSPEARAWARKFLDIAEREIAALQQPPVQLELFAGMPPLPARGPPRRKRLSRRKPG